MIFWWSKTLLSWNMVQRHPLVNKMLTWRHLFHVARAAKPTQTIHTATVWRFLARCLFSFFFLFFFSSNVILPFPTPPPTPNDALPRLSLSYCDISQWAGRRKRCKEAAGAPSRFHPLLYLSFICMCVCSGVCVCVSACSRVCVHSCTLAQ